MCFHLPCLSDWYFTTRDISTHLLVLVNIFHIGRDSPTSVFAQLTLIPSFLLAYCFLLWPGALWELNRVHRVEGPSPESASCMNRYFNFHSLLRISTPSPSRVWHFPRQMKNAHSPCALMFFSMHSAIHSASSGTGNASSTILSSYSSPWWEVWICWYVLMNVWISK